MTKCMPKYFDYILSVSHCGFRQGYGTQISLLFPTEKWRKSIDNGCVNAAVMTFHKAFDCINHNLLIAC